MGRKKFWLALKEKLDGEGEAVQESLRRLKNQTVRLINS